MMKYTSLFTLLLVLLTNNVLLASASDRACVRSFADKRESVLGTDFKDLKAKNYTEVIDGKETVHEGVVDSIKNVPLTTENLLKIYQNGGYPWSPSAKGDVLWWNPSQHGFAKLEPLYLKSGKKFKNLRSAWGKLYANNWYISFNKAFSEVMKSCAEHVRDQDKYGHVWLTPEVQKAYNKLHEEGYAHSVEVWDSQGNLIGGTYGVMHRGTFSAESMFHLRSDAGKVAVLALAERLFLSGHRVLDTQTVNDNSRSNYRAEWASLENYISMLVKEEVNMNNNIKETFPEGFFNLKQKNEDLSFISPPFTSINTNTKALREQISIELDATNP